MPSVGEEPLHPSQLVPKARERIGAALQLLGPFERRSKSGEALRERFRWPLGDRDVGGEDGARYQELSAIG
jgi:hypothetical protein